MRIVRIVVTLSAALSLTGCDKIQSLLKSEPAAADAAAVPSAPVPVAEPSAPVDAAAATPTAPTTVKPITTVKKDGGVDAGPADAGQDAATAFVPARPTRGSFRCDPPGCSCDPGAQCDIKCPGGDACNVEIRELANAKINGAGGALSVTCKSGSTCKVIGASGASVTRCTNATCNVDCNVGNCNVQCTGGKCATNKKSTGNVNCTGCK